MGAQQIRQRRLRRTRFVLFTLWAGAGMSLWGIILGASTGLRRSFALGCYLHERGRGRPPFRSRGAGDWQAPRRSRGDEACTCRRRLHEAVFVTPPVQDEWARYEPQFG